MFVYKSEVASGHSYYPVYRTQDSGLRGCRLSTQRPTAPSQSDGGLQHEITRTLPGYQLNNGIRIRYVISGNISQFNMYIIKEGLSETIHLDSVSDGKSDHHYRTPLEGLPVTRVFRICLVKCKWVRSWKWRII